MSIGGFNFAQLGKAQNGSTRDLLMLLAEKEVEIEFVEPEDNLFEDVGSPFLIFSLGELESLIGD